MKKPENLIKGCLATNVTIKIKFCYKQINFKLYIEMDRYIQLYRYMKLVIRK